MATIHPKLAGTTAAKLLKNNPALRGCSRPALAAVPLTQRRPALIDPGKCGLRNFGTWQERRQQQRRTTRRIEAIAETMTADLRTETWQQHFDAAVLVQELRSVFASGKTRSVKWREEQLNGIARLMKERETEIAEALRQDLNKPFFETLTSEIGGVYRAADDTAKNVGKWMKPEKAQTTLTSYPSKAVIIPEPLGVTLIISPWNYPILLALDPVLGALSAGNVVVLKPSELAPASSALLAKLLPLYVDSSAVRVVEGGVPETTALLEQRWDKIFFTGSTKVGRIVMAAAAKHLTPVDLELGGKSPVLVDSTANIDLTARRIAWGKWANNNGQACVSPDYILAEESVVPKLVNSLKDCIKQFYGENPSISPHISRVVNVFHFNRLLGLLDEETTAEKVVCGGQRNESQLYISPTVILDPPVDALVMQEEIFGPLLVVITVKNVDEAIQFVNARPKPLALYLFTNDKAVEEHVLYSTSSGGVTVNDTMLHIATPGLPFGGVSESGMGSYHGKHSFDTFSHKKSVLSRPFGVDNTLRYPPYTSKKVLVCRYIVTGDLVSAVLALLGLKR